MNMDTNWDDLRVFLTLAREGTLTTAAKALGVSHPTVARRVAALEQQIGARLFDRLPDRFVPTSAGEKLLGDTEAMERAALSIDRRSASLGDTVSGVVRLSAGEEISALLARHLPDLRKRLTQIEFELSATHTALNLSRREADLLIREQVPDLADIVARKLGRIAYAIYAHPSLCRHRPAACSAGAAFKSVPWVGFDDDHTRMPGQRWLQERLEPAGGPSSAATTGWWCARPRARGAAASSSCRATWAMPTTASNASAARSPRSSPTSGCWCTTIFVRCQECGP